MAQRSATTGTLNSVAVVANKWRNPRTTKESTSNASQDEHRNQNPLERYRLLSAKVERCVQELVERVYKRNSSLNFELLAPPSSHLAPPVTTENKEYYFDFYLVWKNSGKIKIERDSSSVCCKVQYLDRLVRWSRAEQNRFLISNVYKKRTCYLNGRGIRDLFIETLREASPDLLRLDFIEHLIYFDLIIPSLVEKFTCHVTLLPCIHLPDENEVLLPFGTLRWYPRSLISSNEKPLSISFQQPLQNMSIRRYMLIHDTNEESTKPTKNIQQNFARVRTIIHELLLTCTTEHVDSLQQLQAPFENDHDDTKQVFFLPHRLDRNCNVFPAGQYLLNDPKAKQFFREFLRTNIKLPNEEQGDNNKLKPR